MKCLVCGFERTPTHVDERPCWCEPSRAYVDRLYDEIARLRTVLVTPRAIGSALQRAEQAEARLAKVVEVVKRIHVSDHGYCAGCGGEWVSSNEWPCETLREVTALAAAQPKEEM